MTFVDQAADPEGMLVTAVRVALQALEERAASLRWMLTDSRLYGLAEPERLRRDLQRDDEASALLRTALQLPGPPASPEDVAPPTF
jgi:hypothetical protein